MQIKGLFVLLSFAILPASIWAQGKESKIGNAVRTEIPPKIDGLTQDQVWASANVFTDFVEFQPNNGEPAKYKTEVRILYDDRAIYVAANMFDPEPEKILHQLGDRDSGEGANADFFSLHLDTYNDDQNGYLFAVTASGVQTDMRISQLGYDFAWDAVWKSEVKIHDQGWSVELEIPYSAIRFPKSEEQIWGLQLQRGFRRERIGFKWSFQDRAVEGDVNQWGELRGIKNIEPPLRLSLLPYLSTYIERYSPGKNGTEPASTSRYFNAGADLKLGLSDGFTLDMTLIPDFGQVRSDNQVLNLSPFEVQFQENRPFFTEGTELFNIANVFYSRRVGDTPRRAYSVSDSLQAGETITENPGATRLLNAFKLSGRTKKKMGLGFFNGMTGPARATLSSPDGDREVVTQAFTNYNVAVVDQTIGKNSYASLINTNRLELDGFMANVTAFRTRFADRENKWFVEANGGVSQRWLDLGNEKVELGHTSEVEAGKASGNFTFSAGQLIESDTYNPNDMGFLYSPNEFTHTFGASYNIYKPFWKFLASYNGINVRRTSLYKPFKYQDTGIELYTNFQFKSFDFMGLYLWSNPGEHYDFFEARVPGRVVNIPSAGGLGGFGSSNYARRLALDFRWGVWWQPELEAWGRNLTLSPRVRVNDKLQFEHSLELNSRGNNLGFVNFDSLGNSLIGLRNRKDVINTFTATYAFTPRMNLSFRARHYWSRVTYNGFFELQEGGYLEDTYYNENHNINFNVFNIDCVFRWRFAPGSDLFLVWKNSILNAGSQIIPELGNNLRNTFESPQTNSLSFRLLYYLDFARFHKGK